MSEVIVRDLIQWLEGQLQLSEAIKVDAIAAKSGYSKWYLQREFKQKKGLSIAEYVRKRRLHEAATLLCASELPIIDIALKYGFSSQQTFSRVFRAHFNTSPAKFRDQRLYPKLDEVMEMNKKH